MDRLRRRPADVARPDAPPGGCGGGDRGGRPDPDGRSPDAALGLGADRLGHFFKECLALIRELEHVDLFVSRAAAEVVRMYKQELDLPKAARIFRDTTAARRRSANSTTASITPWWWRRRPRTRWRNSSRHLRQLATNVFAQAGKCRVPAIVFACDTAPELETEAPKGMVKVYPRRIDLENTQRLKDVRGDARGRDARRAGRARSRAAAARWLSMAERVLFLTGHLARPRLRRVLAGIAATGFDVGGRRTSASRSPR